VPKTWFPGGAYFGASEAADLLRLLSRLPRSSRRDAALARLVAAVRDGSGARSLSTVIAPAATAVDEAHLGTVEDAARDQRVLHMRYCSLSGGAIEWRHASVQRVLPGPPAAFAATCHRSGTLKWFRLDRVLWARLDPSVPYRAAEHADVESYLAESLDRFHGGAAIDCVFVVRHPEASWVSDNLPGPMQQEPVGGGGIRFQARTAGVLRLARFVVGLGAAAHGESPELAALVLELARGALGASKEPKLDRGVPRWRVTRLNRRAVASKRSSR
jgi:predicted DNA-binding transcriptional regulator YafY